jgi:acyl-coenzyme A synthetase/AMP-(fatty) acid ligase
MRAMYPGDHAIARAEQPAVIMAQTGEWLTYGEFEARTNRLAHLLRARGLRRLDYYAIFMENNGRYVECCGAGERTGLYYTCGARSSRQHYRETATGLKSKFGVGGKSESTRTLRKTALMTTSDIMGSPGDLTPRSDIRVLASGWKRTLTRRSPVRDGPGDASPIFANSTRQGGL